MKHFLIIGGGIAGTSLTIRLLEQGMKVDLVDAGYNYSSKVAAGQVNPLVFRRMNKSWRIDAFLDSAVPFYADIEKRSNQTFVTNQTIRRMFSHEQEKELWLERQDHPDFSNYLTAITQADESFDKAKNTFGSGRVKNAFCVHAPTYLKAVNDVIDDHEHATRMQQAIDFDDIDLDLLSWNGQTYAGIIYCLGFENGSAPIWKDLPVHTTKGQVLTISSPALYRAEALNRKCFVIPQPDGQFRTGSTYEWHQPNVTPTAEGRQLIEENLNKLIFDPYTVTDHVAGIRPTTRDRRPICGEHPQKKGHFIFNGLGSKGYMMAPLLSQEMANHLLHQEPLREEVQLERFKAK